MSILTACGAREGAAPLAVPASRAGAELLGADVGASLDVTWLGAAPDLADGRPTLLRFFTDACPYCRASLPALEALRSARAQDGLRVAVVYHPKPPRSCTPDEAVGHARALGFEGPVAVDGEWRALRALVPGAGRDLPTSVSILLDGRGRARWFHPGPELFPSDAPADALASADFSDLTRAVQVLLSEPEPRASR
jgi:thiol-disulfide isomerase/thioredoxin